MATRSVAQIMENTLVVFGFRRIPEHDRAVTDNGRFHIVLHHDGEEVVLSEGIDSGSCTTLQLPVKAQAHRVGLGKPMVPAVIMNSVTCRTEEDVRFVENAVLHFIHAMET